MDTIKVGIIQQSIGTDIECNKQKLAQCIRDVAAKGAQLVVLQELHNSPYFCQVESTENFSYAGHRAGIGITENSDCIAVVVSEETGSIRIIKHGKVHDVKAAEMKTKIKELSAKK